MFLYILYFFLFFSGLSALIIEVTSIRALSLVFGNTIYAFSCVISSFMLGLAAGSAWSDRVISKKNQWSSKNALAIYGVVEGIAGIYAAVILPLLFKKQEFFIHAEIILSSYLGKLPSHFMISFIVLGLPTFLMGMTLPFVSLLLPERRKVSVLYGVNTFGAAIGSLLSTFIIIRYWGCLVAFYAAAIICGFIFILSIIVFFLVKQKNNIDRTGALYQKDPEKISDRERLPIFIIIVIAFLSGLFFVSGEIIWTRIFSLVLGNRIYVTSLTLFIILSAIAVGAYISARCLKKYSAFEIIASSYFLVIVSLCLGLIIKPYSLRLIAEAHFILNAGVFAKQFPFLFLICIFPAVCLAISFPAVLSVMPREARFKGEYIGWIYAFNTAGCVIGSLGISYIILSLLGTNGAVSLLMIMLALTVGYIIQVYRFHSKKRNLFYIICFFMFVVIFLRGGNKVIYFPKKMVVVSEEDEYGVFQVVKWMDSAYSAPLKTKDTDPGCDLYRVFDNTTELVNWFGSSSTRHVQEMQAFLPYFFAKSPKNILNLGTGYGITAGTFTLFKSLETIDTVELLPLMIKYTELFSSGNYRYFENPRVNIFVADGRHFLLSSEKEYDIVSINISDPYLSGSASFFSRDFYRMLKSRLSSDGIVCQHIFGPDVVSLLHQFKLFFPYLKAVPSYNNGINIIGSLKPLEYTEKELIDFFNDHSSHLARIGIASSDEFDAFIKKGDKMLDRFLLEKPIFEESDVRPILEFRVIKGKLGLFRSNQ